MLATNIDRRQSTQTSKRRKGKHASNAHEETRNTNRRRYKQTRQSADHTATASPTNTRHVTPRSKQSHRSKPITRDQQTEPSHPNTTSMHANRPTKPTTAHAKASNRKGEATECDGNNSRCKARLQKAPNPNTPNSVPRASPSTYASDCVRCNNSKVLCNRQSTVRNEQTSPPLRGFKVARGFQGITVAQAAAGFNAAWSVLWQRLQQHCQQ
jgi:hypothetical protein